MKKLFTLFLLINIVLSAFSQIQEETDLVNKAFTKPVITQQQAISPVFVSTGYDTKIISGTRGTTSEWWSFNSALSQAVLNEKQIYTLLFPDTVQSLYEDTQNPGLYKLYRVRDHSVGVIFSPYSNILKLTGSYDFKKGQPFTLDSIAILYNYNRYTDNSVVDTLIVDLYKTSNLLYYTKTSDGSAAGGSAKYDLANNKGKGYFQEVKIPLTIDDTITYNYGKKKGILYVPLTNFNITPSTTYGPVCGLTMSYKPGSSYVISDTLDGDFNVTLPHSKLNHFFYWNLTDYSEYPVAEFNNGIFIYSWTDATPKYRYEATNGNVYWRGINFTGRTCYPYALFKITYDPDYIGIEDQNHNDFVKVYPNPVKDYLFIELTNKNAGKVNIELVNAMGQIVKSTNTELNQVSLDLSNMPGGIYYTRISCNDQTTTHKFILE
jgi:hypothetical protein